MANWQDRDFLRPLYALLTYGPMALMGDINLGRTSTLSMVKLYTAIWHPTPRPDSDTLSCQLDLWKVIVKMVRFGHSEFINGISVCMNRWKDLPTFQNMTTPYQIDSSRLWTKQTWNAASVRMQSTPHFAVLTCIRSKVKGTNSLYPKTNAKVSKSVFAKIADIANAIEISDDEGPTQNEPVSTETRDVNTERENLDEGCGSTASDRPASDLQEDNSRSRHSDENRGPTPPNSFSGPNSPIDQSEPQNLDGNSEHTTQDDALAVSNQLRDHSRSQNLGEDSESTTSNRSPDQTSQENSSLLQSADNNSESSTSNHLPGPNSQESNPDSNNTDKSTRKKRKRLDKNRDTSKDYKPPPKKRKKTAKNQNASSLNTNSTVSVYQKSLEAFSETLFKLPVLVKSEPKVCQYALCDWIYY
jgi:hypothetical protein